jgi:hypothetical protein
VSRRTSLRLQTLKRQAKAMDPAVASALRVAQALDRAERLIARRKALDVDMTSADYEHMGRDIADALRKDMERSSS